MPARLHPGTAVLALLVALAPGPARAADAAAAPTVETGEIAGAQFAIALPPGEWNKRLLLIAHGYRPEGTPLVADLNPARESIGTLLGEGWIVAATSYRRNGIVFGEAIEDLDALRAFVARIHGVPTRVIVEGDSLGGLIATLIAEREPALYDGAVAIDPTLYIKDPKALVGISLLPRIPLLFVSTAREDLQTKSYMTSLTARPPPTIQPALFLISRVGHANVNQAERLEVIRALNAWIEGGRDSLPKPRDQAPYFDATLPADPGPSTAEVSAEDHRLRTRVAEVDPVYGSLLLEAQPQDFAAAGIAPMTYCMVGAHGRFFRTLYGRNYSDVKDGQWIAFPDADGRILVSQGHTSAAATAKLGQGDAVGVAAVPPEGSPLR
jgi:pimeloyl-ACP methyl ester carboxylesterase